MRTSACVIALAALLSPATAEENRGVAVHEKAKRVFFKVLKNATWNAKDWDYDEKAYGSGVGFRKDGWIVATAHQIRDAKTLHVVCPDGATRKADLWHWYYDLDLGVLHIPDYEVPVPDFAKDNSLRIGSTVYLMGAPLAFDRSLTRGIVSGLHRLVVYDGKVGDPFQDYIQVDAQANEGNSGGPLVNARGELAGIVCESLSVLEDPRPAMSYALPIDVVRIMGARLIEEKDRVRHGALKTDMANCYGLPAAVRKDLAYAKEHGVLLFDLEKKARAAGLEERDIVTAVDGRDVANWMHLRVRLAMHRPGDTVTLSISRKGKLLEIPFVLEDWK